MSKQALLSLATQLKDEGYINRYWLTRKGEKFMGKFSDAIAQMEQEFEESHHLAPFTRKNLKALLAAKAIPFTVTEVIGPHMSQFTKGEGNLPVQNMWLRITMNSNDVSTLNNALQLIGSKEVAESEMILTFDLGYNRDKIIYGLKNEVEEVGYVKNVIVIGDSDFYSLGLV